jgi:hypothetical protein
MVSITFPLDDKVFSEIENFSWVNWSEVVREELNKKRIFEEYIKTGKLSDEDWKFCDKIDWHPVDKLPLKEEFVKKLEQAKKEAPIRFDSVDEFFETIK